MTTSSPNAANFTQTQIKTVVTLERVGGSISLVSVVFIFIAFALVRRARNVQNTFIVFASVSNVGASIASIIALDGLVQGKQSALCQTQSFLFEMFMQSDPWWSLAMAINVLLVFYFRASPDSFRRWWWLYCLVCYGGPFTIALTLLLVRNARRGPVYGDATIWCWVDGNWDGFRIYTYYLLIWICIAGSVICYSLVGYYVFRSRNRLHSFSATRSHERHHRLKSTPSASHGHRPDGSYGTVTTEVQITSSSVSDSTAPKKNRLDPPPSAQYFSSVSALPRRKASTCTRPLRRVSSAASRFVVHDPIKRAYLRTSLLFGLSVIVTWIPSSLNRIHSWLSGQSPYEFHLAAAAVLPLQGLWNAIIFFATSWAVVRDYALRGVGNAPPSTTEDGDRTVMGARGARLRTELGNDEEMDSMTIRSDVGLRRAQSPAARQDGTS